MPRWEPAFSLSGSVVNADGWTVTPAGRGQLVYEDGDRRVRVDAEALLDGHVVYGLILDGTNEDIPLDSSNGRQILGRVVASLVAMRAGRVEVSWREPIWERLRPDLVVNLDEAYFVRWHDGAAHVLVDDGAGAVAVPCERAADGGLEVGYRTPRRVEGKPDMKLAVDRAIAGLFHFGERAISEVPR